jgi:hypothetical protein
MDMIAGAAELHLCIAGQAHWAQAEAVRDGRQPRRDPDGDRLVEFGEGLRLYRPEPVAATGNAARRQLHKRLVEGWWHSAVVMLPAAPAID